MSQSNCNVPPPEASSEEVQLLYMELALHLDRDFPWAKGKENARALGYEPDWLERLPDLVWESAAAVGNPFSLGRIKQGGVVVDLGCSSGTDLCIAALHVGPRGRVIGIDVTPVMVGKAKKMAQIAGWTISRLMRPTQPPRGCLMLAPTS